MSKVYFQLLVFMIFTVIGYCFTLNYNYVSSRAVKGNAEAQFLVGIKIMENQKNSKDILMAQKWFLKASKQGHPLAQYSVSLLYDKTGKVEDQEKSFYWLQKSADKGYPTAMIKLAERYFLGKGIKKDIEQSRKWLLEAKEKGFYQAKVKLKEYFDEE